MNISTEQKLIRELFNESSESNPVVTTEQDRFHLEDYVQYQNKPGIIVATIKGESESGIQQLPIGAVDNFRFMKITDENAIINQNKNNGKPYDSILQEYESSKNEIIDQWKKNNTSKLEQLKQKYGDRFLGVDIIQNEKKIQHKETPEEKEERIENGDKENVDEGIFRAALGKVSDKMDAAKKKASDAINKVKTNIHDTFAESEAVKKLISAIAEAKKIHKGIENEEKVKIIVSIENSRILTTAISYDDVGGNSLIFICDPQERNKESGLNLAELRKILRDQMKIDRLSRSVDHIYCGLDPEKYPVLKNKEDKQDEEQKKIFDQMGVSGSTISKKDNIQIMDNRPMKDIKYDKDYIVINYGKTRQEQEKQDKEDNLFT